MNVTKLSELTAADIAEYLRLSEVTAEDTNSLTTYLTIAKSYIVQYTGYTLAELDAFSDVVQVALILCQDMYDNRSLYIEKSNLNYVVESTLDSHRINLL
jgi:hypothetical protein